MHWLPGQLATPIRQPTSGARVSQTGVTSGLAYLFHAARGDIDVVRNRAPTGGTRAFATGREGAVFSGNGSSRVIDLGALGPIASLTGGATLMAVVEFPSLTATTSTICSFVDGAAVRSVSLHANDGTNSNLVAGGYNNVSTWTAFVSPNNLVAGRRYVIIATYNDNTTLQTCEINDVSTTTAAITFALGEACSIGARRTAPSTYNSYFNGNIYMVGLWTRQLARQERASLAQNPWSLFQPEPRVLVAPQVVSVTVYRPGGDVITNNWTATPGGTLASCIDDPTLDRGDYITSPNLSDPATLDWATPVPAGTWDMVVDGVRLGATGQIRIVCLDAGGSSVGATSWQPLTASATTYTLSVTTSATSTRFRIEVQP